MKKMTLSVAIALSFLGLPALSAPAHAATAKTEHSEGLTVTVDVMAEAIQQLGDDVDPDEAYETWMKWRGERESDNVIDLRGIDPRYHRLFIWLWDHGYRW